jgi:AmiR/NasT family two-component response regulator
VAEHSSQILASAGTLAIQLQTALSRRVVIDQAIGVLRGRTGADAAESFERLRRLRRTENSTLVEVAQRVVDEAIARAGR